jgi:hypothetical protein
MSFQTHGALTLILEGATRNKEYVISEGHEINSLTIMKLASRALFHRFSSPGRPGRVAKICFLGGELGGRRCRDRRGGIGPEIASITQTKEQHCSPYSRLKSRNIQYDDDVKYV